MTEHSNCLCWLFLVVAVTSRWGRVGPKLVLIPQRNVLWLPLFCTHAGLALSVPKLTLTFLLLLLLQKREMIAILGVSHFKRRRRKEPFSKIRCPCVAHSRCSLSSYWSTVETKKSYIFIANTFSIKQILVVYVCKHPNIRLAYICTQYGIHCIIVNPLLSY